MSRLPFRIRHCAGQMAALMCDVGTENRRYPATNRREPMRQTWPARLSRRGTHPCAGQALLVLPATCSRWEYVRACPACLPGSVEGHGGPCPRLFAPAASPAARRSTAKQRAVMFDRVLDHFGTGQRRRIAHTVVFACSIFPEDPPHDWTPTRPPRRRAAASPTRARSGGPARLCPAGRGQWERRLRPKSPQGIEFLVC